MSVCGDPLPCGSRLHSAAAAERRREPSGDVPTKARGTALADRMHACGWCQYYGHFMETHEQTRDDRESV